MSVLSKAIAPDSVAPTSPAFRAMLDSVERSLWHAIVSVQAPAAAKRALIEQASALVADFRARAVAVLGGQS